MISVDLFLQQIYGESGHHVTLPLLSSLFLIFLKIFPLSSQSKTNKVPVSLPLGAKKQVNRFVTGHSALLNWNRAGTAQVSVIQIKGGCPVPKKNLFFFDGTSGKVK